MEPEFLNLLHTHPSCPFCGHIPDQSPLVGLNCEICQRCTENIHIWNPAYAELYTEDGVFELWAYIPTTDTWTENDHKHAVFLDRQPNTSDLSKETQTTITAYLENRHLDALERIPRHKAEKFSLTLYLPTPIIATQNWIYTKDASKLPDSEQHEEQIEQATLTEAV